jgi:hypothetical protein
MKKLIHLRFKFLTGVFTCLILQANSVAQDDSVASNPMIKLHYYSENNNLQYLVVESMLKSGKTLTPQVNKRYDLYLSDSTETLVAQVRTNNKGKALATVPSSFKTAWGLTTKHNFKLRDEAGESVADLNITKARISIDTTNEEGVKNIIAILQKQENNEWVPVPEAEMKVGVSRLLGNLSGGDEETYTTDSSGTVTVPFSKENLPGDTAGNILLTVEVVDNEELGNLKTYKKVPWGVATKPVNGFFEQRTLWSTRYRTPIWLLFMAYSIIAGVWGTLIYLLFQIVKIRRLRHEV